MIDVAKKQAVNGTPGMGEGAPLKVKPEKVKPEKAKAAPKSPTKRRRAVKKNVDKSGVLVEDDEDNLPLIKKHKSEEEEEGQALEFIQMDNGFVDDDEEDNEGEA